MQAVIDFLRANPMASYALTVLAALAVQFLLGKLGRKVEFNRIYRAIEIALMEAWGINANAEWVETQARQKIAEKTNLTLDDAQKVIKLNGGKIKVDGRELALALAHTEDGKKVQRQVRESLKKLWGRMVPGG